MSDFWTIFLTGCAIAGAFLVSVGLTARTYLRKRLEKERLHQMREFDAQWQKFMKQRMDSQPKPVVDPVFVQRPPIRNPRAPDNVVPLRPSAQVDDEFPTMAASTMGLMSHWPTPAPAPEVASGGGGDFGGGGATGSWSSDSSSSSDTSSSTSSSD